MPPTPRARVTGEAHSAGAGANATVSLPQVGAAVLVQWPDKQTASDTGTWPAIVLEVDRAASTVRCQHMGTGGVTDVDWVPLGEQVYRCSQRPSFPGCPLPLPPCPAPPASPPCCAASVSLWHWVSVASTLHGIITHGIVLHGIVRAWHRPCMAAVHGSPRIASRLDVCSWRSRAAGHHCPSLPTLTSLPVGAAVRRSIPRSC